MARNNQNNDGSATVVALIIAVFTFVLITIIVASPVQITYSGKFDLSGDVKGLLEERGMKIESAKGAGGMDSTITIKAPFIFFWAYGKDIARGFGELIEYNPALDVANDVI